LNFLAQKHQALSSIPRDSLEVSVLGLRSHDFAFFVVSDFYPHLNVVYLDLPDLPAELHPTDLLYAHAQRPQLTHQQARQFERASRLGDHLD